MAYNLNKQTAVVETLFYDYFIEADSDSIKQALEEFDGDFDEEELRLYRLKFMSEIAN